MAKTSVNSKFSIQHLEFSEPPLPRTGGRLMTPSGELAQIISDETIRHVAYIEFKPDGKPRGNHYHATMNHAVYVIQGKLRVTLLDLDDMSRTEVNLVSGDIIRIKPNCVHVFVAQEYSQALELNDTAYDPADTIPYIVPSESGKE